MRSRPSMIVTWQSAMYTFRAASNQYALVHLTTVIGKCELRSQMHSWIGAAFSRVKADQASIHFYAVTKYFLEVVYVFSTRL